MARQVDNMACYMLNKLIDDFSVKFFKMFALIRPVLAIIYFT